MNIFVNVNRTPYMSNALRRIDEILHKSAKDRGHKITTNPDYADAIIAPVVNHNDLKNVDIDKTIVWQLCYLTSGETENWWKALWKKSLGVVSYLKLPTEYLRLPLGYDPNIFNNFGVPRIYDAIVTGYVDGSMGEEILSVVKNFDSVCHVGKNFNLGGGYHHFENISDSQMAFLYNQSKYVIALRHTEGFELPVVEGAACGCIPVVFNEECYSYWFENMAIMINEPKELDLVEMTSEPPDIETFVKKYKWSKVMNEFWNYVETL